MIDTHEAGIYAGRSIIKSPHVVPTGKYRDRVGRGGRMPAPPRAAERPPLGIVGIIALGLNAHGSRVLYNNQAQLTS